MEINHNNKDVDDYLNIDNFKNFTGIVFGFCLLLYVAFFYTISNELSFYNIFINHNNSEVEFSFISLFLSNYTHMNLIHLAANLFFGYQLIKSISKNLIITKGEFLFIHTVGAFIIGLCLFIAINYIPYMSETSQAHIGYSAILFSFFGILFYTSMNLTAKIVNVVLIVFIYALLETLLFDSGGASISHIGHFIGFMFGVIFSFFTGKKYKI